MALRLLILSTPVAPLGSGLGGGMELTVTNLVQVLQQRGHRITVLAPEGSQLSLAQDLVTLPGQCQPTAHTAEAGDAIVQPEPSVLAAMWAYARDRQAAYDLILQMAYDWLPFYLTPFFTTPIAHFVSMGSLTRAMDDIITQVAHTFPGTVGLLTQAQAHTFPQLERYVLLGSGLDLSCYDYCPTPGPTLAWLGRISPEKGLEDAIAAAAQANIPLQIMGKLENTAYWHQLQRDYPNAPVDYLGFFATPEMQARLGTCRALVMTPRWVEAFGNVAIEALACGVPVIAYNRGGPTEIVRQGKTGWLVEPDNVAALVEAIGKIDSLDRAACRHQAEAEFSLAAWGDRFEQWLMDIRSG